MRKKTSDFFSAKKKLEMLEFLHKYAKLCSLCLRLASKLGSCRQYRASLPLPMWSSGDSRPPVPWSAEERRREMTNLIANQKGAASKFYNYMRPTTYMNMMWTSQGGPAEECRSR